MWYKSVLVLCAMLIWNVDKVSVTDIGMQRYKIYF